MSKLAVDMALVALHRRMGSGQRKRRRIVIERRRLPGRGRVALRAVVRKIGCDMAGVRRSLEVRLMTRVAIRGRSAIARLPAERVAGGA